VVSAFFAGAVKTAMFGTCSACFLKTLAEGETCSVKAYTSIARCQTELFGNIDHLLPLQINRFKDIRILTFESWQQIPKTLADIAIQFGLINYF
jgi:hypothetical protein